jgi:predicted dehydrogenase
MAKRGGRGPRPDADVVMGGMRTSGTRLAIGVAGVGHFGRYHALKVAAGPRARLVGVTDHDPARAAAVAAEVGCPVLDWDGLLAASEAVVIAAPAEAHFSLAAAALGAGRHVLVEKPMTATLDEADELTALAAACGLVLQVGHLLRYTAEHAAIVERMRRPLYIECLRIAPFKPRGTDVSVILDLMIHDLDLVLALVDSEMESVDAVGAPVASEHEDIANARVHFANGCVATITASRISLRTERKMRLFGREGYLSVDFAARQLTMIGRERGLRLPMLPEGRLEKISWKDRDALAAEHAAFVAAVLDGAPVLVDAVAGRRALRAALAVMDSMEANRARAVAGGLIAP